MSTPEQMHAEHDAALRRLLALSLSACERIEGRLAVAETDEEVASRTLSFTRAARAVRQTVALREKLVRDHAADARVARREAETQLLNPEVRRVRREATEERKMMLREVVETMVWTEVEDNEAAERLADALGPAVEREARDAGFLARSMDGLVAALRAEIGLEAARSGAGGDSQVEPAASHHPSAWGPASAGLSGEGEAGLEPEDAPIPPPRAADSS